MRDGILDVIHGYRYGLGRVSQVTGGDRSICQLIEDIPLKPVYRIQIRIGAATWAARYEALPDPERIYLRIGLAYVIASAIVKEIYNDLLIQSCKLKDWC
jgi:hypothetical protein